MTAQDIIDFLNKLEDKTVDVYIWCESEYSGGISQSIEVDSDGDIFINGL